MLHNTHQVRCCHFFIVEVIAESVNLIQMSKQNRKLLSTWWRTIRFLRKSTYQNTEQKEGCSCNFILQVNETKNKKRRILSYLTKTVLKRTSDAIFSMKKLTWMNCNWADKLQITEAATGGLLWEKVFLGILQNSQENTRARVFKNTFFL